MGQGSSSESDSGVEQVAAAASTWTSRSCNEKYVRSQQSKEVHQTMWEQSCSKSSAHPLACAQGLASTTGWVLAAAKPTTYNRFVTYATWASNAPRFISYAMDTCEHPVVTTHRPSRDDMEPTRDVGGRSQTKCVARNVGPRAQQSSRSLARTKSSTSTGASGSRSSAQSLHSSALRTNSPRASAPRTKCPHASPPCTSSLGARSSSPRARAPTRTASSPTCGCGSVARSSPARNISPAPTRRGAQSAASPKSAHSKFAFNQSVQRQDETPGPGSYEIDTQSLAVRALASHNKSITAGKGSFMTSMHDDRSAPRLTEDGDPTLYSDYYLQRLSVGSHQSSNRRVREGRVAFNSDDSRCGHASFEDRSGLRGPGSYDYSHLYETSVDSSAAKAGSGTTAFTSKAPLLGYIRKIDTPGAGEYDPRRDAGKASESAQGSAAFAGSTARCAEPLGTPGTAGPGTYDQGQHSIARSFATKRAPCRAPPFGSSVPNAASASEASLAGGGAEAPGPGSYEIDTQSLAVRALASHNKSITAGKGSFMTSMHDDRSAPRLTEDGDPTLYSDYYLQRLSVGSHQSSNRRVREGRVAFNSDDSRCGHASFEDRSGLRGPGSYDYSHLYETSVDSSAAKAGSGTTAFTSKAPLLGYIRKIDTPGAGEYDPRRDAGKASESAQGSAAFAGSTARCAEPLGTPGTAGPGTYDQGQHSIARTFSASESEHVPPFGSSSRRF